MAKAGFTITLTRDEFVALGNLIDEAVHLFRDGSAAFSPISTEYQCKLITDIKVAIQQARTN